MTESQKKAADRVRKLLAKTEGAGCSAGEVLEATRIAREILTRHDLDLSEVERLQDAGEEIDSELFNPEEHGLEDAGERIAWTEMLARIVSRVHGCEILVFDNHSHVAFIGREMHRKMVVYLYGFLCRAAKRLSDAAYREAVTAYERQLADYEQNRGLVDLVSGYEQERAFSSARDVTELITMLTRPRVAPEKPEERTFKHSFCIAFIVAIEQRFNDRLSKSGALVLASKKAKEHVEQMVDGGEAKEDKTENLPAMPDKLNKVATYQGYAEGVDISIDANVLETNERERAGLSAGRTRITEGTPPTTEPSPGPVFKLRGRPPCRMRMSFFGRGGIFFPQGQVVSARLNDDKLTYTIQREDDDPASSYSAIVTAEYLEGL